jgi:hypothetical protein
VDIWCFLKGPNWHNMDILALFCQNLGVLPPGVSISGATPWGVHIFFKISLAIF